MNEEKIAPIIKEISGALPEVDEDKIRKELERYLQYGIEVQEAKRSIIRKFGGTGTQYRSAIFYTDAGQEQASREIIQEITDLGIWPNPIVTEVSPLDVFYAAEDYHQNYYRDNPYQPYCQFVVAPKVAKFRKTFRDRLKAAA